MKEKKYPFSAVVNKIGLSVPRCEELEGKPLTKKNVAERVESKSTALVYKLACQAYLGLVSSLKVPQEPIKIFEDLNTRAEKAKFTEKVQSALGALVESRKSPTLEGVAALGLLRLTDEQGLTNAILRQQALQVVLGDPNAEEILKSHPDIFDATSLLQKADPLQNFPNLNVKSQAEVWELINGDS